MTPEERRKLELQVEIARRRQQDEMLTHPGRQATREDLIRQQTAEAFGLPTSEIDISRGVPSSQRALGGLLTDPMKSQMEAKKFYSQKYPGARIEPIQDVLAIQQPGQPVMFANPPGFERGDVAEFTGAASLPTALSVLAAGAPMSAGASMVAVPLAGILGELGREGLQYLAGTQAEPWEAWALRSGVAGATELLPTGFSKAVGLAKRQGTGALGGILENTATGDLQRIMAATDEGFDIPTLMKYQASDDPVFKQFANQVMRLAPDLREKTIMQLEGLRAAAQQGAQGIAEVSPSRTLAEIMRGQYEQFVRPPQALAQPTPTGQETIGLVERGLKGRKTAMESAFNEQDKLLERWQPKYDLSGLQNTAKDRQVEAMPLTPEEEADLFQGMGAGLIQTPEGGVFTGAPMGTTWFKQDVLPKINVAPPNRKLAQVNAVLARIDPRQGHEVVSELRKQVGQVLNMPLLQRLESGVDIGQAKKLYQELWDAELNPLDVVPGARQGIIDRTLAARDKALSYYDTYDQAQVRKALIAKEGQTPAALYDALARNPEEWEQPFLNLLTEADKGELSNLRNNILQTVKRTDNPLATIDRWEDTRPEAYKFLFPEKETADQFRQNARWINEMNSGPWRQAYDSWSEQQGFARYALNDAFENRPMGATPAESARLFVDRLGGKNSEAHNALRATVWEEVTGPSLQYHPETGVLSINPKNITEQIAEAKNKGWWTEVLSERDRKGLEGLQAAARRMWARGSSGTSLTLAAQIGNLRDVANPGEALGALGSIRLSRFLSKWFTSDFSEANTKKMLDTIDPRKIDASQAKLNSLLSGIVQPMRVGVYRERAMEQEPQAQTPSPTGP